MMNEKQREQATNLIRWYARIVTECALYDNWSAEFVKERIQGLYADFVGEMQKLDIDFNNLSKQDLECLGCDKNGYIPMYLYDVIPDGVDIVSCLEEDKIWVKDAVSDDNRGGWLAYRFIPADNEKTKKDKEPER